MSDFKKLVLELKDNYDHDVNNNIRDILENKLYAENDIVWLSDRAKQGDSCCQNILGEYHYYVTKDNEEATKLYYSSAIQDDKAGKSNLAYMVQYKFSAFKNVFGFQLNEEIFKLKTKEIVRDTIDIPKVLVEIIISLL